MLKKQELRLSFQKRNNYRGRVKARPDKEHV